MANCNECGDVCILISDDCLCNNTPLKFLKLKDYPDLVNAANDYIEDLTGKCDLCEGLGSEEYEYVAIIGDARFKRLYANLIYAFWLENYGDGKPTAAGYSTPQGDNFSDFTIQKGSQVKDKLKNLWFRIESMVTKFKVLIDENGCIECEKENKCGCNNECNCGCNEKTNNTFSGFDQIFLR